MNQNGKRHAGMVGSSGIASGIVTMDDRAERAPLYRGFFISPNQDQVRETVERRCSVQTKSCNVWLQVMSMVNMEPTMINENCDGVKNRSGCYDIVVTDMITNFWPSNDGRMPPDEPVCGYRGEKVCCLTQARAQCDYTLLIIGGILLILLLIFAIIGYILNDVL